MQSMNSTMLIGPYDWDEVTMPRSEYAERIASLWTKVPQDCSGIVVWGDRDNCQELTWLAYLVPKLNDAMLLLARGAEPLLHLSGGKHIVAPSLKQTWIDGKPFKNHAEALTPWAGELRSKYPGSRLAFVGGDGMRTSVRNTLSSIEGLEFGLADTAVRELMSAKRPREVDAVRAAASMVDAAIETLRAGRLTAKSLADLLVDAEEAAYRKGAQDVRLLHSIDGGKTYLPSCPPGAKLGGDIQGYVAVRYAGYWSDGFFHTGRIPQADAIAAALSKLIPTLAVGTPFAEVTRRMQAAIAPHGPHPITTQSVGSAIGLCLDDGPGISADSADVISPGEIYSLRAGARFADGGSVIVSALVRASGGTPEILWTGAS